MFGWKKRYEKLQRQYGVDMCTANDKSIKLAEEVGNLRAIIATGRERTALFESFASNAKDDARQILDLALRLQTVSDKLVSANKQLESFKSEEHALKMQRERVEIDRLAIANAKANIELQKLQREAQNGRGVINAQHLNQGAEG